MITLRSFLLSLVLLISGVHLRAQDRETVTQSTEWFAITSTSKITKNLNLYVEGQFRYSTNFDPLQYQFRIAPEIVLPKNFSVVPIAYVYTWNYKYGEQPASFVNNEHRLWEQVSYKHSVSRINMSHRVRLEQRFIQDHAHPEEGDVYSNHQNRLRYRFMANIPLNHQKMEPKTYYASVYDEIFYSWGGPVEYHHPDQNRIFAGLGYQATKLISFQGGFLYQMLIKKNGAQQENNIGFQLQLNYNFDFTKHEN